MNKGWKKTKIKDLALKMADAPFGSNLKTKDYKQNGLVVIQGKNIDGRVMNWNDMRFVTREKFESLQRHQVKSGALVFPKVGTIGKVGILTPYNGCNDFLLSTNTMMFEPDLDKTISLFVYYYFSNSRTRKHIEQMSTSSVQPVFNFTALKNYEINLPPLPQQKAIANILGKLDDKIELNRKMNQTLEEMAQALFKSWFVDFDPVIDNALAVGNPIPEPLAKKAAQRKAVLDNPKTPALENDLKKLFPDSFVFDDSLNKWIPAGWEVDTVENTITINPKISIPKGEVVKFVDMKALPTSGYSINNIIEKEFKGGSKFEQGDILLARITPCLENGKTAIVDFLDKDESAFGSTEFIVLRGKGNIRTAFVACLARYDVFVNHCIQNMVGSSGRQRVQNSCFNSFFLCLPQNEVLSKFDSVTNNFFTKITETSNQTNTLTQLRDTLLPQLISGKLEIPEALLQVEKALEEKRNRIVVP